MLMSSVQSVAPEILGRYRRLESALIYDVLDSMGLPHQQLSLSIQPLDIDMVVAGPAFTSKATVSEAAARVALHTPPDQRRSGYDMLEALYEGCILVEDVGNDPVSGGLGEN